METATAEPPEYGGYGASGTELPRLVRIQRGHLQELVREMAIRLPQLQQLLLTAPVLNKALLRKDNLKLAEIVRGLEDQLIPEAKARRNRAQVQRLEEVRNSSELAAIACAALSASDSQENRRLVLGNIRALRSAIEGAAAELER